MMLVFEDGSLSGTVGGGCGEAEVWQKAQELLLEGETGMVCVDLTESPKSSSPKVCGGRFDVLLEVWRPDNPVRMNLARRLSQPGWSTAAVVSVGSFKGAPTSLPLPLGARAVWCRDSWSGDFEPWGSLKTAEPGLLQLSHPDGEVSLYLQRDRPPHRLLIAGAGHIARPLCAMASIGGFQVVVVDDRADYAQPASFPGADSVLCQPFGQALSSFAEGPEAAVVLVTRGHLHDEECLRQMVGRDYGYVGMIGSQRRVGAVFTDLKEEGVEPAWLERVCAPIGLDIGARTPEEIAVCILAEIVQVFRRGQRSSLSLSRRKRTGVRERH